MGALFVKPLSFTVTAANESTLLPASNANLDEPALVYRSNNLTTPYVILDMGTSASYDTVAIMGSNLRATDTVQIRTGTTNTGIGNYAGSATAAWTGTLPESSTAKAIFKLSATRTERYVRIDFVATSHPDGYVQAQRIVVGKALALSNGAGVDLGHSVSFMDQSVRFDGAGWSSYDRYDVLPVLKLSVSMVGETDWRNDWFGFLQTVGQNRAFLVVPDDATPANWQVDAVFGRVSERVEAFVTRFDMRRIDLAITGLAP